MRYSRNFVELVNSSSLATGHEGGEALTSSLAEWPLNGTCLIGVIIGGRFEAQLALQVL